MTTPGSLIRQVIRTAAIILLAALLGSVVFGFSSSALSLAAGFAIAAMSFTVLVIVIVRTLGGGQLATLIAFLGIIKMGILGLALWWLLSRGFVEPLAFLAGFSTMVIALFIEGMRVKKV